MARCQAPCRELLLGDVLSWRTLIVVVLFAWIGLWQLVAGTGLLFFGYRGDRRLLPAA